MKKMFLAITVFFCLTATQAQLGGLASKAKSAAGAAGFDVNKLTQGIMGKLVPALSLSQVQTPKVTDVVSSYLTGKSKILSLANTDKAAYSEKQGSLFSTLKTKLAGILLKNQMNKFLGLKPATNSPANVLSQLFY